MTNFDERFDPNKPIDLSFLRRLLDARGTDLIAFLMKEGRWHCIVQVVEALTAADEEPIELLGVTIAQDGLNLSALLIADQFSQFASWAELAERFLFEPTSVYNISGDLTLIDELIDVIDFDTNEIKREQYLAVNGRSFEGSKTDEEWFCSAVLTLKAYLIGYTALSEEAGSVDRQPKSEYGAVFAVRAFENGFAAGRLISEVRKLTHLNSYYLRGMRASRTDKDRGAKGGQSAADRKAVRIRSLVEQLVGYCDANPQWRFHSFKELAIVAAKMAANAERSAWKNVSPQRAIFYLEDLEFESEFSDEIQRIKGGLA